jgi:hypothetical protein
MQQQHTTDARTASMERDVERSEYQAIGYVWGRQDMGEPGDTIRSLDFGRAYAERKRAFLTEESYFLPNIRDAYEQWHATGEIKS